jgi:pilus assembly protein FimV
VPKNAKSLAQHFFFALPGALKGGVAAALCALLLGAPSSAPAQAPSAQDAAITTAVNAWAQAWSAKDVERYLGAYAPAFKPASGLTREAWEKQRRTRITAPSVIEVTLDDLRIQRHDDTRAAASFRQRYKSDRYQDQTDKTLELVRDGERWLIVEERTGPGMSRPAKSAAGSEPAGKPAATPATAAARPEPTVAAAGAPAADAGITTALGRMRVFSALGQPLRAEIEASPLQRGTQEVVAARLAPPEAYARAGIEYMPDLAAVSVAIEQRGGKPVISVTTLRPVNEPFLRLLIELQTKSGRLVREYTALLDPPSFAPSAAPLAATPPTTPVSPAPLAAPPPPPAVPGARAPAVARPSTPASKAARVAEGRIRTTDATAVAPSSKAQVKLPGTEARKPRVADDAGADDHAAQQRALREAQSRNEELEKAAADLAKLIEIRNLQIAELEKRMAQARPAQAPAPTPAARPLAEAPKPAVEAPKPAVEAPKPTVEATKAAAESPKPVATAPKPTPSPAAKQRPAPVPPPPAPSLLEELTGDPVMLGGLGGVAALLALYGAYSWRRRKRAARASLEESQPMKVAPASAAAMSAAAAKGEDAPATVGEELDPIAEADVYMAYGRDGQAEEILRESIARSGGRPAVYLKLLQIYAKRHDAARFEAEARNLMALSGGEGPEWEKAMALGRSIDPGNELYGQGEGAPPAPESEIIEAPTVDFDLGTTQAPAPSPEVTQSLAPPALDFDIGGTTGELKVAGEPAPPSKEAAPEATAIDLSAISLDLGAPEPAPAPAAASSSKWQEVAVKLDIAKAYHEIGDTDGARELLNEVINDGDPAQQELAKKMLASFD